jgi:hypothetical protein
MAQERSISEIISIATISQFLAGNDIAKGVFMQGGALDNKLDRTLYMERLPIEGIYALNPTEPNLRKASNYLFALCGKYAYQAEVIISGNTGSLPVVSGPANQTINISGTASFTIGVTSSSSYTIAWYRNGILVVGQTGLNYSYAATIANNDDTVSALVTNTKGTASSGTGILTVTENISGFFWFGDTDPYANLAAGIDDLTYQTTFPITTGQPLSIDFPDAAANNRYNVTKYPLPQGVKTTWYNTPFNNGTVPDAVFQSIVTIGQFYYIISREAMSLDPAQNLVFS